MVYRALTLITLFIVFPSWSYGQDSTEYDSLKIQLLALQTDVDQINLNLEMTQSKFQSGILIAPLG